MFGGIPGRRHDLCAPSDTGFQNWLSSVPISAGRQLRRRNAGGGDILTQAWRSRDFLPGPCLVAGDDALLRITGWDADGGELFSLSFEMPEVADGDGSPSFVFALPVRAG